MYLFFDCETNGLPKNWDAKMTNLDNWPRVIQIAWQLNDSGGVVLEREKFLIKPNGWTIPKEKFWIDNGYSTEENHEKGIPILDALKLFAGAINRAEYMIAHNLKFDHNVIGAEFIRSGIRAKKRPVKICTMESSKKFCALPGKFENEFKWPKLVELHQKLFNETFDDAHDALADVRACARCFFELIKNDVIKID